MTAIVLPCPPCPAGETEFPPEVVQSFVTLHLLLVEHNFEELLPTAETFQMRYPLYRAYYLELSALALQSSGKPDCALPLMREACTLFANRNLSTLLNLCALLREIKAFAEAKELAAVALAAFPGDINLQHEQVRVLQESGEPAKALAALQTLCATYNLAETWYLRAEACMDLALYPEALNALQQCWTLDPTLHTAWHNGLFLAHYMPKLTADDLRALHRQWYKAVCGNLPSTPEALLEREHDPNKRLRIGLFSAGFQKHPAGWMASRPLRWLSKLPGYELFFYNTRAEIDENDELRALFKSCAAEWQDVGHLTDAQLYERALADRLDMAVDMAGHSDGSVLPLFAVRLAPVQIKWVGGLFNTTSVPAMDYLLSDSVETPKETDTDYVEKLVRLPYSYISYVPPDYGDEPDDLALPPKPLHEGIVFGCFNNAYKINPVLVELWAQIMRRTPGSHLFLKGKKFDWPDKQLLICGWFAEHGIEAGRLRFEGASLHHMLLKAYHEVDIALDTWPYTGGLTTLEALWMGVPVITTPGPTFAGRHAASHLHNVGLPEFIAPSFKAYADMAVELAHQPSVLDNLRLLLRHKVASSPIVDHRQLAADLHTAFRAMWERYCAGLPPVAMRFDAPSTIPDLFD